MGTSLSGLTPATTFDGLLKTSDNQPLDGTLKAISTGDGTDTMLELSTSALQIGGDTGMYWDNTNKRLGIGTDNPSTPLQVNGAIRSSGTGTQLFEFSAASLAQFRAIFGSVGFRVGNGVFIGGADGGPSANTRLHIKGKGATSATTSLLVQNSAGTQALKVTDDGAIDFGAIGLEFSNDGSGGTMSVASDRYVKIASSLNTYSALNAHVFKTLDGSAYSEAMRITGNTDQFVGIGESTPTARLHVKGSGNDNTTTSLLVQNSDGVALLDLKDSGLLASALNLSNNNVLKFNNVTAFRGSTSANEITIAEGFNFQNTIIDDSQLTIKGRGATSATTALLVQNSAGTELFDITDNGEVEVKSGDFRIPAYKAMYGGGGSTYAITLQGTTAMNFKSWAKDFAFYTQNGVIATLKNDGKLGLGESSPTAKLQVKGSGNDNTTTALLVQNSDGVDGLKITDDLTTVIQGNLGVSGGDVAVFQNNADPTNQFKINKLNNSSNIWHTGTTNTEIQYRDNVHFRFNHGGVTQMQLRNTGNLGLGVGGSNASARMHIKGSGATSATTALLVQNSAGTELLKVRDDGDVITTKFKLSEVDNALYPNSRGDLGSKFSTLNHFKNAYLQGYIHITKGTTSDSFSTYNASAKLQVDSTTQGFLPPRMTTTERDAISTPASGLMVYNTTTNKAQCYNGTAWQDLF